MKHIRLFESFEIVDPIKDGQPLNNREINILRGYNIMCPEFILKDDNYYYVFNHRCENIKDLPFTYIHGVCSECNIENYTINDDYTVDVRGNVFFYNSLSKIPLKFNIVSDSFYFSKNKLTTLKGSPKKVGGNFWCHGNKLTTLEGGPMNVGENFDCRNNGLTTLEGSPKKVGGNFNCSDNKLTTLEGGPESVGGYFDCSRNLLSTLSGCPVGGYFKRSYNKLTS